MECPFIRYQNTGSRLVCFDTYRLVMDGQTDGIALASAALVARCGNETGMQNTK